MGDMAEKAIGLRYVCSVLGVTGKAPACLLSVAAAG